MILTLDRMGQRYGRLPSEIIHNASTFDLVVMDTAMTLERHYQDASQPGYVPDLTVEELLKIKEQA